MTHRPTLLIATLALACSACTTLTHTDYVRPNLAPAASWSQPTDAATMNEQDWWTSFRDEKLNALVEQALTANNDLIAAGIKLRRARLATDLAQTQRWPQIDANAQAQASRPLSGDAPRTTRSSSSSLAISWEIDLFGKLAAQADAASWGATATEKDLAATRLSLVGTVVTLYFQLALDNEQIARGQQSIGYAQRALELVRREYKAGAVSRVEVLDAEQTVESQEATQRQYIRSRSEHRSSLAALLGQHVYEGPELAALPSGALPKIAAGLPVSILSRRPDLAAAEFRLRETLSDADATRASFYPSFNLTGALGTASSALLGVFGNPAASASALVSLPFLNVAQMNLTIGQSQADYDAAVASFRQAFYNALSDVEISLATRAQYAEQGTHLLRAYDAAKQSEVLYERQYRSGAIKLRAWLDAQDRRRSAEHALAENRLNALLASVGLYLALGGEVDHPTTLSRAN